MKISHYSFSSLIFRTQWTLTPSMTSIKSRVASGLPLFWIFSIRSFARDDERVAILSKPVCKLLLLELCHTNYVSSVILAGQLPFSPPSRVDRPHDSVVVRLYDHNCGVIREFEVDEMTPVNRWIGLFKDPEQPFVIFIIPESKVGREFMSNRHSRLDCMTSDDKMDLSPDGSPLVSLPAGLFSE